jgi:hypothetical protein
MLSKIKRVWKRSARGLKLRRKKNFCYTFWFPRDFALRLALRTGTRRRTSARWALPLQGPSFYDLRRD